MRRREAFYGVQAKSCTPATWRTGEREGNPSHSKEKSAPKALRSDDIRFEKLSSLLPRRALGPA